MKEPKHILVVTRTTGRCHDAVHYAISLSQKCGATLHVLHVMDDAITNGQGWNLSAPRLIPPDEHGRMLQKTKEELDAVINTKRWKGVHVIALIRAGNPRKVVRQVAAEKDIDLIIMPDREQWRVERFLLGSGNPYPLRRMPCSILTVKRESAGPAPAI